jgi:CRISPR-associated protein Cas2
MKMIVTYDISDPKRLNRVAKVMEDFGVRVQQSVFEVELDNPVFRQMKHRIEQTIDLARDGVKYFPLCEKCAGTLEIIHQGQHVDPDEEFYIL